MVDDLAARIRDRRLELGLTQAELAQRVGRAPSTIGSWESGRSRPADEATAEALARILDLDSIDTAERVPAPPARAATPSSDAPPAPSSLEPVAEAPPSTPVVSSSQPVRTDTDPLYRIRAVATVVAVLVLGWVFVQSIGAAGDVIASIADSLTTPFRG